MHFFSVETPLSFVEAQFESGLASFWTSEILVNADPFSDNDCGDFMEFKLVLDGDISIIKVSGRIELEKNQQFRNACLKNFSNKKVVFCMKNINFVGSTGIQHFFGVLNELNADKKLNVKIAGLGHDFKRLLSFTPCSNLEIHESIEGAVQSF